MPARSASLLVAAFLIALTLAFAIATAAHADVSWLCRFGDPTCGIEDVFGFAAGVGGLFTFALALFGAIYLARTSAPVVTALEKQNRILTDTNATRGREIADANARLAAATELVTNRGNIEALISEVRTLVGESTSSHKAMTELLKTHDERTQVRDKLVVQGFRDLELTQQAIVARLERKGDARATDGKR